MRFYLARRGADDLPVAVATVEVEGGHARVVEGSDAEVAAAVAAIARYPDLPLRVDERSADAIATTERRVTPDDPGYPYAFGQVTASACGLELSFRAAPT